MGEEASIRQHHQSRLSEAILSISSLISLSHSIKVFSAKWQSIRIKLEELFSNLTAIENCETSSGNSSLSIAVESILGTLRSCDELANRCLRFSYSGKLLMQSDLDILSAKLDSHIESFSDIYSEGLLTQSYAIVVPRPSVSASKDDMRFYITDLLSRMKIGSSEMKKQALIAFNEVIEDDERYAKIAVEIDGLINFIVKFLDFQDGEIQEAAAKSVSLIAGFNFCKTLLIGLGTIGPLIRVLESGNEVSKEYAARCLMKVTENSDNVWSVSAHGGVTALLKLCSHGSHCQAPLVSLACSVLKNLVTVDEIKRFMVEEGAITELVELIRSKDESAQISSLDLLQAMAFSDESVRETIIKEGGIRAMVRVLDPRSPVSTKIREIALRGITNICFSSENSIAILMNCAFIDHILYFLRYGEVLVQELALKAAFWLCGTSEEAKKVMGDAGFMPVLVKFLDSKSFEVREMAAETLSNMLVVARNRKKFVQSDQNVVMLLQMLDPTECEEKDHHLRVHEKHRKACGDGRSRREKDRKKAVFESIPGHFEWIMAFLNHIHLRT
ncbi:vacuolar protein 8 isoform X2 [Andrographis paniculata]|uniref:vacuolar protein 8 isoform X2 n=1 Tax=Andrographis paniculata TaxID=175694 RepID=UPI0021E6FEAD|nr:vacuolar protein 8 isoform X2 [Andrographis paniculata]XP_051133724.1 vacuolar protein 8 isoform X2 [Andrographis paniculata]XP_051133726.1 vacuolar protein 8 isoform X2 [Andrographis paniculata]XP_051133727.1 vacuolar protein 8 isoform X2 [Andrographis paniculata]